MPPHPLTIKNNAQLSSKNEPRFSGVYSRYSLPKIKDGTYVINLDKYEPMGTHWIVLYVNGDNVAHFDSLGVEHITKEIKKFIGNKTISTYIFRIQAYDSIICDYFCIGFIEFMSKGKSLLVYTNFLSPNEYGKNDKIVLKYF